VPGLRLFNAYRQRLTGLGARWQFGFPAIAVEALGGRISTVRCEGASREITVECEDLVLATGGVAGHGIEAKRDGSMVEVVAGLPVAGMPDRSGFVGERFLGEHPVAAAGVQVDSELRPVDGSGAPIYTNLHCVGGLLSDHDPTSEGSREGVGLASASRVAELLAPATTSAGAGNGGTAR
jgi:glycerol-3-phosphate dehydrogenase subunit B